MSLIYEPFRAVRDRVLSDITSGLGVSKDSIIFEEPSKPELGDLAFHLIRMGKLLNKDPEELSHELNRILSRNVFVEKVIRIKDYLDIYLDPVHLSTALFSSVKELGENYGLVPAEKKYKYVIEYVSANPIHPLHIGSGRNAALGIVLSSMLKARGYEIQTRFYVNDMGRQVAIAVLGFRLLDEPNPPEGVKPDEWIGFIYAATHTIIDIRNLKNELEKAKIDPTKYREILEELDVLVADSARLRERFPEYFDKLVEKLSKIEDPEKEISRLMISYEKRSDESIIRSFRKLVDLCLKGFKETLDKLGARFDKWDYESDIAWSGLVDEVINLAKKSVYYGTHKNAPAIIFKDLQKDSVIRERLRLPRTLEIPPLIIMRSDETTLYTLRDVAYSIYKFRDGGADYVINIIASEQTLPQAQIRLALYALGFRREAENMIHFSYELVSLPGHRMSGRRGRYITLDQVIEEARIRAEKILEERGTRAEENIAEKIAVAAVKYALASVSPSKQLVFKLEEALDFERNSAPYILYSRARAKGILDKIGEEPELDEVDFRGGVSDWLRRLLVLEVSKAPSIYAKAVDELSPEIIANTLIKISDLFNTWYQKDPVIHEKDLGLRAFKILLVKSVLVVLTNGLKMMGIEPLDKI
ncbi:MAG: arginine--tRNA ligase [Sulfolobales archaeon]